MDNCEYCIEEVVQIIMPKDPEEPVKYLTYYYCDCAGDECPYPANYCMVKEGEELLILATDPAVMEMNLMGVPQ